MGAGGIAGELRDHSEHVDRIIRSNFNAANGQTTSISASSHSYSNQQTSTNNFNSTGEALEEMACFSCSSNFSLFRRKNLCQNCKRHYCNDCFAKETKFVPGESVRNCLTCRALQYPIAYKDHLRKLKVRDLQEYLRARQISTNQCKEKRDLIELILRHAGDGSHTGNSTSNPHHQARRQTPADPPLSNSQRPEQQRSSNVFPSSNSLPVQVPPSVHMPVSVCKSLSQIQNIEEVEELSVKELKQILKANFVDFKGCCEKKELLDRVRALWKSKQPTKGKDSVAEDKEDDTPDDLCKICMDASIDCVLLECGHMVTCTKCGKQLADCPICRQNIARIVHVFKA